MSDPLWTPLVDGHVLMALLGEHHRSALASACAEDRDIWGIYSISFDPLNFDKNFNKLVNDVRYRPYAVTIDGRVVGMTSYIDPDQQQGVVQVVLAQDGHRAVGAELAVQQGLLLGIAGLLQLVFFLPSAGITGAHWRPPSPFRRRDGAPSRNVR